MIVSRPSSLIHQYCNTIIHRLVAVKPNNRMFIVTANKRMNASHIHGLVTRSCMNLYEFEVVANLVVFDTLILVWYLQPSMRQTCAKEIITNTDVCWQNKSYQSYCNCKIAPKHIHNVKETFVKINTCTHGNHYRMWRAEPPVNLDYK